MRGLPYFIGGAVLGLTLVGCLGGVAGYVVVKSEEANVRRGWFLVPVVVYVKDLATGEVVGADAISQRSVPEQFLTDSVVKPDSASYVVNQRVVAAVGAGDPVLWSHFDRVDFKLSAEAGAACAEKFPPAARFKTVAELRASLEAR